MIKLYLTSIWLIFWAALWIEKPRLNWQTNVDVLEVFRQIVVSLGFPFTSNSADWFCYNVPSVPNICTWHRLPTHCRHSFKRPLSTSLQSHCTKSFIFLYGLLMKACPVWEQSFFAFMCWVYWHLERERKSSHAINQVRACLYSCMWRAC